MPVNETTSTLDLNERCYPGVNQRRVISDHLARYNFAAGFVQGKDVADIGCGEGYGADMLSKAGAHSVIGLDSDSVIIGHASGKYPDVSFSVGDAVQTGLPSNSIDVVTCFEVWHHLDRPDDLIPELKRILRPGGILIISVPNKNVIYLNPLHRRMLTPFYRKDFDRQGIESSVQPWLSIEGWYGQRFIRMGFSNPLIRFMFFLMVSIFPSFRGRVENIYKLGNGSAVSPVVNNAPRTFVVVARALLP